MTNRLLVFIFLVFATIPSVGQEITRQDADSMLNSLKKTSAGIDRIDLLLSLAQFQVFKPGENKVDFDSATTYINEATALNKTVKSKTADGYIMLTTAFLTKEKGQLDEAKKLIEQAIPLLESGDNKSYLGKARYELSTYYDYRDDEQLPKKIALVQQAIDNFQQAGNIERKAFSLKMLGDLYASQNRREEAIATLKLSLDAYNSIHYTHVQGIYSLLGRIYSGIENERLGLQYSLMALKTAEMVHDTTMQLCEINNNLGRIYAKSQQKELALKYSKDAFEIAKKHNDGYNIALIIASISAEYAALGRAQEGVDFLRAIPQKYLKVDDDHEKTFIAVAFLNAYVNAKQFTNAKPYCDLLLQLENSPVLGDAKFNIYRTVASYYVVTKQYEKARVYLLKERELSNRYGGAYVAGNERLWYKLDSSRGDFHSAFNHLLFFKTINDSLFNETKSKQIQQLEVEYETAKKQDSLTLKDKDISLLIQANNLQQSNLKQARIIRNATIAGIMLAIIIIGLLYRQYRHKQKSNDLILNKNNQLQHLVTEKEWLLKEIHHRVKNNLQTIMSLLGTQSGYLKNDIAINAITDSQRRIQSMSLIHQKLYQSNNLSVIRMPDYIHELVDSLNDSFNTDNRIRINLEIEPIEFDLAHCIPLGLILNEAITNSFKYAFPDGQQGVISISLKNTSADNYLLTIKDNGTGLPAGFNVARSDSMGMNLMRGLSAEIGAQFTLTGQNGTRVDIGFTYDPDNANEISQLKTETSYSI